jgi:hypothetical protein
LIPKVIDNAVYLFDHRFGKNLNLNPDLNRCDGAPADSITGLDNWRLPGYDLSKRGIAPPCADAPAPILDVQHAVSAVQHRVNIPL